MGLLLRRHLLLTTGLALALWLAALFGGWLAVGPGRISAVWPAAGVALAALVAFGRRGVAGVAIGIFLVNWDGLVGEALGHGGRGALGIAVLTAGDLAEATLAARLLAGLPARMRASPVRETLRFALVAIASGLVGATVGEGTLYGLGLAPRPELFFGWITWWLGDACGMLVVTPGLLLLADPRLRGDRLTLQAFPLMCLGLGLTAFSTFAVGLVDRDAHIERFRADAGRLAMTLQGQVELALRDLEALQHAFYKVDLDREEFHALCAPLLARSRWQSTFEWLPRVTAAGRDRFETSPSGLDGISIRQVDASGAVVRAGPRAEYFPVAWTEPEAGRETLRGLDHAADAERGAALARARGTGATTSSPPLSTIAYSPDERVVQTLYAPVAGTGARVGERFEPAQVRGVVAATMDLASMLQASIAQVGASDATALLYDPDAPHAAGLRWHGGGAVETVVPVERDRLLAAMTGGVSQRLWIRVGDRRWGLAAQPGWASTMPRPSWLQGAVLCSGLAFTGLLTAFLVVRRRRDEVLESARGQLERQVHARTQDLAATNRRLLDEIAGHRHTEHLLQEARRNAEAANRAKSQFLANMSHEIRTPLNAVLGYTQLLIEDRRQPADSRERLRIIHAAGRRLLGLINDVLDLAKIEAGGLQVHVEPIDLRRELEEIATLVAPRIQAKGLALRVDIDLDSDAALLADRAKFGQIVLNLLGNALKFTDAGTIVLRAWRAGADTIVEVEDTGPGMDAQELASVFTAFRQGAAGVDKGGTGLGLNLSRHLATALGGELAITSTPGRGTCVCLRLPMAEAGGPAVAPPALEGGRRIAPGTRCRVLVVEDDAHSRDVLVTLLRAAGCEVVAAEDGAAGLEACVAAAEAGDPFAIVFSDIRMPRMDGLRLLAAVRADERTRALPMVAVSASSLEHERRFYIAEGFEDFVGKPYGFETIYAMLARHAGCALVAADGAEGADADAMPEAVAVHPREAGGAEAARRAAARATLAELAERAADGAVAPARRLLATLSSDGAGALPPGLLAQLEADLRAYDFAAIESRVRAALAAEGQPS